MKRKVRYELRPGFRQPKGADINAAGHEIERIKKQHGDKAPPAVIVESARPKDSPIHPWITWDIREAARKCQEEEAGYLCRSYYRVESDEDNREMRTIANVSIQFEGDEERSYVSSSRILTDEDIRNQVRAELDRSFLGLIDRYRHLPGLKSLVMEAIARIEFPSEGKEAA